MRFPAHLLGPRALRRVSSGRSGIQFSAEGPSDGADAATLVSDFLLACAAGPQDDYATARLFLSAASARSWQPGRRKILI